MVRRLHPLILTPSSGLLLSSESLHYQAGLSARQCALKHDKLCSCIMQAWDLAVLCAFLRCVLRVMFSLVVCSEEVTPGRRGAQAETITLTQAVEPSRLPKLQTTTRHFSFKPWPWGRQRGSQPLRCQTTPRSLDRPGTAQPTRRPWPPPASSPARRGWPPAPP